MVTGASLLVLLAAPAQAALALQQCAAGYVRLTFDDGPHGTATPNILYTLADWGNQRRLRPLPRRGTA
jgi:peptidoglycan/xylan/chitin deacetylase (PgdA/CDA1 family)